MDNLYTEAYQRFISDYPLPYNTQRHDAVATAVASPVRYKATPADAYVHYLRSAWQHIERTADQENIPIYLFGAGEHTRWLLTIVDDIPSHQLRGILDDQPTGSTLHNTPVYHTEECNIEQDAMIVLSSDRYEQKLYDRACYLFGDSVKIVRLYEHLPPGPYPRPKSKAQIQRQLDATHRARARWGGSDFVGPYEQAGYVTGFLQEQWLWSRRKYLLGHVLDMSTPKYWHQWVYELPSIKRVSISDFNRDMIQKDGYLSPVNIKGDFCAAEPPAPAESFDTVLCLSILEHCHDPARMLANLKSVLIPGGTLLLAVPYAYIDGHCRPDYWRFGRDGLQLLARRAGYTYIETGSLGDIGPVMSDVMGFDMSASDQHDGVPLINWLIAQPNQSNG